MDPSSSNLIRIGDWRVNPAVGEISRGGETARLEARTMRLLLCLAERSGEVVSIDELLDKAWAGVAVSPDSVYQAVASLRRLLGDDPKQPAYIATVPRLGYRLIARVEPWTESAEQTSGIATGNAVRAESRPPARNSRFRIAIAVAAGVILSAGVVAFFEMHGKGAPATGAAQAAVAEEPAKSIAVLPFLDLTEGMREEEFADGMTEELIDKLSKVPGLRVPSPTSSFYFKNKQVPVAEMARSLGVVYALDGSVRKSGGRVRVAARLIRAENGFVIWSETYDRPFGDILMVQDDIAGEVTKALKASIAGAAPVH